MKAKKPKPTRRVYGRGHTVHLAYANGVFTSLACAAMPTWALRDPARVPVTCIACLGRR